MRTVVTGGAGFIGSHLTDHLLARGDEVVVLDDLSTGSLANLAAATASDRFTFQPGSVLDQALVRDTVRGADRIFHLAAAVGVHRIVDDPLTSLRTNIHGTETVLEAALAEGAEVLITSTSEIYGKNTADSLGEESDMTLGSPLLSRWSYAAAKGLDEAMGHAYWTELGLPVSIVRLFNTVGPRQTGRYGMVVPNLVGQALRDEPVTVYGDGRQTRCFSYVGDVVPAVVAIQEAPESRCDAFNLGGALEISILDLARRIIHRLGSRSEVVLIPYEQAYGPGYEDMRRRVPNNAKSKALVGFEARTGIDEIIDLVAADLRARATAAAGPAPTAPSPAAHPVPAHPVPAHPVPAGHIPAGQAALAGAVDATRSF
ncbi:NAD-dependent epimerase/dehydratase family protein [Arsenicicoccus sp. oral taxon 190]|uniref:NAD-dependent epimerase/dehydratase family protein n=1 Tax=Arsenicicoccus sp. oral taxon 190 TaxID=1658671 RepID=UPI0009E244DD|nr:NAD-dependent epimerase/dehydratase family protein [Arsenicicoccus sp. oral taxon 190]